MKRARTFSHLLVVLAGAVIGSTPAAAQDARTHRPDGIEVHGHWTIDVRNADGTLASHNEFENECWQCGQAIVPLLARQASVASWYLQLASTSQNVCLANGQHSPCYLFEAGTPVDPGMENAQFPTLALAAAAGGTMTFTGNFTASFAGDVSIVVSRLSLTTTNPIPFSSRTLATVIPVAAGQKVYVKVTFSFS